MTARLDRIEGILEQLALDRVADRQDITQLRATIEAQSRDTVELRSAVTSLLETAEIHQQNFEAMQRNFEVVLTEIRGLRTESQRILEYLFDQQQQGS